jgi:hypothetical protein
MCARFRLIPSYLGPAVLALCATVGSAQAQSAGLDKLMQFAQSDAAARGGQASWVTFKNGARGIASLSPLGDRAWYLTQSGRPSYSAISRGDLQGTALVLRHSAPKLTALLASAARISSPFAAVATVAMGDPVADGTVCGSYSEPLAGICRTYGVTQCDAFPANRRNWMTTALAPCIGNSQAQPQLGTDQFGAPRIWHKAGQVPPGYPSVGESLTVLEASYYPDLSAPQTGLVGYSISLDNPEARLGPAPGGGTPDVHECLTDVAISCPAVPELTEERRGLMWAQPLEYEGNKFMSDVWEPLDLPAEVADATPEQMNPDGQLVTDVVTNPNGELEFMPWPQNTTGTVTDPVTGDQQVIEIDMPDMCGAPGQPVCAVRVENIPKAAMPDPDELELERVVFDASLLAPGAKWLPNECPDPLSIPIAGQTLELDQAPVCTLFGWIGLAVHALGALTGALIIVRS